MKTRSIILTLAMIVAAWLALFGDKTPSGGIAKPITRNPASAPRAAVPQIGVSAAVIPVKLSAAKVEREPVILILQPRDRLIDTKKETKPGDSLFASQSWVPTPPPPAKPTPTPPPSAPPLPFTYLGKKIEDGIWEVYLARGEQSFIVRENTIIEDRYRIESIKPPTLSIIYLPLKQVQMLTIGGTD
jgi:hypothetical protein